MRRAVLAMPLPPTRLLVDGNRLPCLEGLGEALHGARDRRRRRHASLRSAPPRFSRRRREISIWIRWMRSILNMLSQVTRAMPRASTGGASLRTGRVPCTGAASRRSRSWRAAASCPRSGTPRRSGSPIWTRTPSSRLRGASRAVSQFVHLRLHTEYSLVDGIVRVPELMAAVGARAHARDRAHRPEQLVCHGEVLQGGAGRGREAPYRRRCLDPRGGRADAALAQRYSCARTSPDTAI